MAEELTTLMTVVGALVVVLFIITIGINTTTSLTDAEIKKILEHTTRSVSSVILNVATTEQAVRRVDLKNSFGYNLNETHITLLYIGETHTTADDNYDAFDQIPFFTIPHNLDNIEPSGNFEGVDRICVSKRIIDCVPVITICDEGDPCCTLEENRCKYIS